MKNKLIILFFFVAVTSCAVKKDISKSTDENDEFEYYYIFTEATNRALLKDYFVAEELYKSCIKKFPERATPYYQLSQIYLDKELIPIAKNYASQAVELEENNKWYLLNLASIYNYEKNLDSLIYVYEKIVKISNEIEYRYQMANLYSMSGEYRKALDISNELDKEIGDTKEILLMKHKIYDALNMKDSAVVILENIILLFPEDNENYGMLAEYLSVINEYDRANEIYLELLKRTPNNGMANISYADFFNKQNLNDSAYKYYLRGFEDTDLTFEDKASIVYSFIYNQNTFNHDSSLIKLLVYKLKNDYDDSKAYVIAAEYYMKLKQYENCLIELDSAIIKGDNNYIVWEKYILMCNYLGKHQNIKFIYKTALKKFPNALNLYLYSGYSLLALNEYDEVLNICDSALKIKDKKLEDWVQINNLMADSYSGKLLYDKSDSIYEIILVKDPANLLIRNNYSYYLSLRKKNLDRAEKLSRLTVDTEPKNATYLDTYGWILFQMGNIKEALRYIEAAIKNGAYNNSEVLEHYGDVMWELKRCEEAVEAWNEAIKYDESFDSKINQKLEKAKTDCIHE